MDEEIHKITFQFDEDSSDQVKSSTYLNQSISCLALFKNESKIGGIIPMFGSFDLNKKAPIAQFNPKIRKSYEFSSIESLKNAWNKQSISASEKIWKNAGPQINNVSGLGLIWPHQTINAKPKVQQNLTEYKWYSMENEKGKIEKVYLGQQKNGSTGEYNTPTDIYRETTMQHLNMRENINMR